MMGADETKAPVRANPMLCWLRASRVQPATKWNRVVTPNMRTARRWRREEQSDVTEGHATHQQDDLDADQQPERGPIGVEQLVGFPIRGLEKCEPDCGHQSPESPAQLMSLSAPAMASTTFPSCAAVNPRITTSIPASNMAAERVATSAGSGSGPIERWLEQEISSGSRPTSWQ